MIALRKQTIQMSQLIDYNKNMNKHTLKDTINRTRMEALDYLSDLKTEKEPVRKAFLDRKYKELCGKYESLTGRKLEPA